MSDMSPTEYWITKYGEGQPRSGISPWLISMAAIVAILLIELFITSVDPGSDTSVTTPENKTGVQYSYKEFYMVVDSTVNLHLYDAYGDEVFLGNDYSCISYPTGVVDANIDGYDIIVQAQNTGETQLRIYKNGDTLGEFYITVI